jgi:uncharacterized membrane protein
MSFSHYIEDFVQVIEAVGVAILVIGGAWALIRSALLYVIPAHRKGLFAQCRRHLGHVILLGLEVLIIADIIQTVIVHTTPSSVAGLATIVIIRILLSFSLAVEIDGTWPWNRLRDRSTSGLANAEEEPT